MKKYRFIIIQASVLLFAIIFTNGCVKDTCKHSYSYTFYQPVYKTTAEVRANIKSNAAMDIKEPGKIAVIGNYIYLNEVDKGIHIIDNSNPASPKNTAFIDIPGNVDLALKGNTLYADLYTDLVTLDVSNPLNVSVKKYNEGVFPFREYSNGFYGDTTKVIVNWIKKNTTITEDCNMNRVLFPGTPGVFQYATVTGSSKNSPAVVTGLGGSMARFAIVNNTMYTVSNTDLNVFNITNLFYPAYINKINISNWNIETIFPFQNKLFIGSQNGMYVYNINDPHHPDLDGQFGHVQSCDPVIADNSYAYVTLRSGNACQGFSNELDILQLNNYTNPSLIKTYSFTNPFGLSKDNNLLFICDGADGLKVYDASDVMNLKLQKEIPGIETYDVIASDKIASVVAKDGLYQYDYSDVNNIHLLSKMNILQ